MLLDMKGVPAVVLMCNSLVNLCACISKNLRKLLFSVEVNLSNVAGKCLIATKYQCSSNCDYILLVMIV